MRILRIIRPVCAIFPLILLFTSSRCHAQTVLQFFPQQATASASVGVQVAFTVSAIKAGQVDPTITGTLNVAGGDAVFSGSATTPGVSIPMTAGTATVYATFDTPGLQTITATIAGTTPAQQSVAVTSSVAGCSSCYASIGAGAVITNQHGDYNNVNNVLETTHLGTSTPQYVVGVAYKLPVRAPWYSPLGCKVGDFTAPSSDARAAFCYPFKAFVSFKFTPDSSQTFNGFTYGISHAIHKSLDILLGLSYSASNEVSPGFQAAAVQVVKAQQAPSTGSVCYAQWNLTTLEASHLGAAAYDGFPTQLLTQTGGTASAPVCTAGAQIYSVSPLATNYHSGLFIGISVPVSFSKLLGGK